MESGWEKIGLGTLERGGRGGYVASSTFSVRSIFSSSVALLLNRSAMSEVEIRSRWRCTVLMFPYPTSPRALAFESVTVEIGASIGEGVTGRDIAVEYLSILRYRLGSA